MENKTILDDLRASKQPIVLFGASSAGRKIYCELKSKKTSQKEICFCDNYKQGIEPITQGQIITPKELADHYTDAIVCVCIMSPSYRKEVYCQLNEMGFLPEQILEYPQLAEAMIAAHGGELTWADSEKSYDWTVNHPRIAKMSQWLNEEDRSVIDFGAGDCYLKQCLRPGVKYIPTDYVARTPEHIVFDFNKDPFPDIRADVCFLGFTLLYAKDWKTLLRSVCKAANHKVIIGIGIQMPSSDSLPLSGEMVHFCSEVEVLRIASEQGFELQEKHWDQLGDGQNSNKLLLLLVRIK